MNPNLTDLGVTFEPETHTYRLEDGREIPSVTHILRFMNVDISEFADRNARDRAAERGKRIHEACMIYDYEGEATVEPDIAPYLNSYAAFIADYNPNWKGIEFPVCGLVSLREREASSQFAGTVDRYGAIDGELYVVDIKTGTSRNYPSYIAQASAYGLALRCHGIKVKKVAYLILKPDGYTFKTFDITSEEATHGVCVFYDCFRLHKNLKEGENHGKRKRNDSL